MKEKLSIFSIVVGFIWGVTGGIMAFYGGKVLTSILIGLVMFLIYLIAERINNHV